MRHSVTKAFRDTLVVAALACVTAVPASAQDRVTVTDASINAGENVVWTADKIWVLDGFVFVEDGASLTIEPGTTVEAKPGGGEDASALIIARGGKIFAIGTATAPIVFTVEGQTAGPLDAGLWGGVIILGNATLNTVPAEQSIEGIPEGDARALFGGDDDDDNSGVFRYVSIRHGGSVLGVGDEINGLTLGAVGRSTQIDHVEVFGNLDDGIEWFGGTVNTHHMVVAFCRDDGFDYDMGFRGKHQFWVVVQNAEEAGEGGEHDGGTSPEDGEPFAEPVIYNATFIGSGLDGAGANTFNIRDNAGGHYHNSIFTEFTEGALRVEDLAPDKGADSRARLEAGQLEFANNIWWDFGVGNDIGVIGGCGGDCPDGNQFVVDHLSANANRVADPMLRGISRIPNGGLDPRPLAGSPALTGAASPPDDGFFQDVGYVGAFGPEDDDLWLAGWTYLDELGILVQGARPTLVASESSISSAVPEAYAMANAPNPWNPSTTIDFALPVGGQVDLSIYNAAGQKIATLVQGFRPAGSYAVQLSGDELASGIYYYRLVSPSGILTRPTTLLK